jgi:hypothetical protein
LEYAPGAEPGYSLPRDRMEFARAVDAWSRFGIPLSFSLSLPSDPARAELTGDDGSFMRSLIRLLAAKQSVVAVECGSLDDESALFPRTTLLDPDGRPGPVLQSLTTMIEQEGASAGGPGID